MRRACLYPGLLLVSIWALLMCIWQGADDILLPLDTKLCEICHFNDHLSSHLKQSVSWIGNVLIRQHSALKSLENGNLFQGWLIETFNAEARVSCTGLQGGVWEHTHTRVLKVNVDLWEHALSCISRMLKAVKVNSVTIWIALIQRCSKGRGICLGDIFISVVKTKDMALQ